MLHRTNILFLWQHGLLGSQVTYSDGRHYDIVSRGLRIAGSDVDFTHASLREVSTGAILTGSVRVDVSSSDWKVDNRLLSGSGVILHVVFSADSHLFISGHPLLTAVVSPSDAIVDVFKHSHSRCVDWFGGMDDAHRESIIEHLALERLNRKAEHFIALASGRDWAEAAYVGFVGSMGYGNRAMFEKVALSLPLHYLEHHFGREQVVEALFLGQAGLLNNIIEPDEYTQDLLQEFIQARSANSLLPPPLALKHLSRGHSSPAISLIRAAHILCQTDNLLDNIILARDCGDLREMFNVCLPSYWCDHIGASRPTKLRGLDCMSGGKIDLLIINFVAPLIVGYGRAHNLEGYSYRAIDLLEQVRGEDNRYVRRFSGAGAGASSACTDSAASLTATGAGASSSSGSAGYKCRSAYASQALTELGSTYCSDANCTGCPLLYHALVHC